MKVTKKTKKVNEATGASEEVEEVVESTEGEAIGEDSLEEATEASSEDEAPAKTPVKTPAKKAQKNPEGLPLPEVSVSAGKHNHVSIVALKNIVPAPVIGHYDMGYNLNIKGMVAGSRYTVPLHVAQVLVDSRAAVIV